LRDLLAKGFTGREIRYLLISSHYRESFNFTLDGLGGARTALARIDELVTKLRELAAGRTAQPAPEILQQFSAALDEDLNVSAAWGHIFEWVRATNKALAEGALSPEQAAANLAAWETMDQVLGVGVKEAVGDVPQELLQLLEERQAARKARDFKRADAIRDELKAKGWIIEDTPKGPRLKRI
jgi:cysteinyl-tRNA synthetase